MLAARGPSSVSPGSCESLRDLEADDGRCNERLFPWGDEDDWRRLNILPFPGIPSGDRPAIRWWGYTTTPGGFYDGSLHEGTEQDFQTRDGSSVFGAHDMAGNLFEWTGQWFDLDYYRTAPRNDPQGPENGTTRAFLSAGYDVYAPFRSLAAQGTARGSDSAWKLSGFRCVREADAMEQTLTRVAP
jgi:formylglycine-generating enzyme required for sulfatase activity